MLKLNQEFEAINKSLDRKKMEIFKMMQEYPTLIETPENTVSSLKNVIEDFSPRYHAVNYGWNHPV